MNYVVILFLLICIVFSILHHLQNMKLLRSVSSPNRGTRAERKLIIRLLKMGVHPKAVFHDLYLKKRNGEYSQIDIVVATPQGLLVIEVKDYSGWLFGNEKQKYWTQILNYGKEKYRFYNPLMQNYGHIKALRAKSEQFACLPIFNIVLFAGNCTLKDVSYTSDDMFVGYVNNIDFIFDTLKRFSAAKYLDKRKVVSLLREAVDNGNNPSIVAGHIASVQRLKMMQPQPVIRWGLGFPLFNRRRFIRF